MVSGGVSYFSVFFCFKQTTAYELLISDWSLDVCSSDLQTSQAMLDLGLRPGDGIAQLSTNSTTAAIIQLSAYALGLRYTPLHPRGALEDHAYILNDAAVKAFVFETDHFEAMAVELTQRYPDLPIILSHRSEEHTSELPSLMRI